MNLKRSWLTFLLLTISQLVLAQEFRWLKGYNSVYGNARAEDVACNEYGMTSFLVNINSPKQTDTIDFGNFHIPTTFSDFNSFVVTVDLNDSVVSAYFLGNGFASNIAYDSTGDMYIIGRVMSSKTYVLQDTIYKADCETWTLKLKPNGQKAWMRPMGSGVVRPENIKLINQRLYAIVTAVDTFVLGDSAYYFNYFLGSSVIAELNPATGVPIWSRCYHVNDNISATGVPKSFRLRDVTRIGNDLYVCGDHNQVGPPSIKIIGGDTIIGPGGFILKTDLYGNYKKNFSFHHYSHSYKDLFQQEIATDGEFLYVIGNVGDTMVWGNKVYPPNFESDTFPPQNNIFVGSIDPSNMTSRWVFLPKVGKTYIKVANWAGGITTSGGYIYACATAACDMTVGSVRINPTSSSKAPLIFKLDFLGQVLWATSGTSYYQNYGFVEDITAHNRSVYCTGSFSSDTIIFGNLMELNPNPGTNAALITRLTDYRIIRGFVRSGPYCAGDSIVIPVDAQGVFDSTNYFVAELSDEFGNFNGKEVELVRIKARDVDTLLGILPETKVNSSGDYRIRVYSTAPFVQSYYVRDSLRLLIYSRDTAYVGDPEIICPGDSIQIETTGGTSWAWSPNYHLSDSTARNPWVWPTTDTSYQIIISDSSGCGQPDTAVKVIRTYKPIQAQVVPYDTTICIGDDVHFKSKFISGDTATTHWSWHRRITPTFWSTIEVDSLGSLAELQETIPSFIKDSAVFHLRYRDQCSAHNDTAILVVRIDQSIPDVQLTPLDSSVCPGSLTLLKAFSDQPDSRFTWRTKTAVLRTISKAENDSLPVTMPLSSINDSLIILNVNNGCSSREFVDTVRLRLKSPLQILGLNDTTICTDVPLFLKGLGTGGDSNSYTWQWTELSGSLSDADTFSLTPTTSTQVVVRLSDACMPDADSITLQIDVNPALQSRILLGNWLLTDTTVCDPSAFALRADVAGGNQTTLSYQWSLDGTSIGSLDTVHLSTADFPGEFDPSALLKLHIDDGCSRYPDSVEVMISLPEEFNLLATDDDTLCYDDVLDIIAKPTGGVQPYRYEWTVNTTPIGTDSVHQLIHPQNQTPSSETYVLSLSDACLITKQDSFIITYLAPLTGFIDVNDTCVDASFQLTGIPSGGKQPYAYSWEKDGSQRSELSAILLDSVQQETHYQLTLMDGCMDAINPVRTMYPKPRITAQISPLAGCEPLNVEFVFSNVVQQPTSYSLATGAGNSLTTDSALNVTYGTGKFDPVVTATSVAGCTQTLDLNSIRVYPKPKADFTWDPLRPTPELETVWVRNTSVDGPTSIWFVNDNPVARSKEFQLDVRDTGTRYIKLIVYSIYGCTDTLIKVMEVVPQFNVFVPTAFTPNGDGLNDEFLPIITGTNGFAFQVYNRWGEMVHDGDDQHPWKATNATTGIYVYQIQMIAQTGEVRFAKGTVLLTR